MFYFFSSFLSLSVISDHLCISSDPLYSTLFIVRAIRGIVYVGSYSASQQVLAFMKLQGLQNSILNFLQ